jgi:hypothetical protein
MLVPHRKYAKLRRHSRASEEAYRIQGQSLTLFARTRQPTRQESRRERLRNASQVGASNTAVQTVALFGPILKTALLSFAVMVMVSLLVMLATGKLASFKQAITVLPPQSGEV